MTSWSCDEFTGSRTYTVDDVRTPSRLAMPSVAIWGKEQTYTSSLIMTHSFHCEKQTLFTKPEVLNALHCRQRRTEPRRSGITFTEFFVKFGRAV